MSPSPNAPYIRKAIRRIPLHSMAFAGHVGIISYILWASGYHHFYLLPGILGTAAAFLKEGIENLTITQVWPEFWIDSLAQTAGTILGLLAMKLVA